MLATLLGGKLRKGAAAPGSEVLQAAPDPFDRFSSILGLSFE